MKKHKYKIEIGWTLFVYFFSFAACVLFGFLLVTEIYKIVIQDMHGSIDTLIKVFILFSCSLLFPVLINFVQCIEELRYKDMKLILHKVDLELVNNKMLKAIHGCICSNDKFNNDIRNAILDPGKDLMIFAFNEIVESREQIVFEIIQAEDNIALINNRKSKLNRLIPIMEVVIEAAENTCKETICLHKVYAQMAYILKDSFWTKEEYQKNLMEAYKYIENAIRSRDMDNKKSVERYHVYEFNRLILGINIEDKIYKKNLENDLNTVQEDTSCIHMLSNTNMTIAPNLSQWLIGLNLDL